MRSKFKLSEREEEIIMCYEIAGDLALLCLQQREKRQPSPSDSPPFIISSLVEMALSQAPLIHLNSRFCILFIWSHYNSIKIFKLIFDPIFRFIFIYELFVVSKVVNSYHDFDILVHLCICKSF